MQLARLLAKGKFKDAVKQAKLLHKAEPTPENHRGLENAYFLRAQQLLRSGMADSAVEVSRHLLEFGLTDPKLREEFPQLLARLGLAQDALRIQGVVESAESQNQLLAVAADQAVLHPERTQRSALELQDAGPVRQALEALYAGDEAAAMELVRNIARNSPFSDWKLFLRGLAAYYRGEKDEAQANWNRLDPKRAPARICRQVAGLQHPHPEQAGNSDIENLERLAYGEPILVRLREVSDLVVNNRWDEAIRRVVALRLALRAVDPRLEEKLTAALIAPLLEYATNRDYATGMELLVGFTRAASPLAIDPRWNRFWALCWEEQDTSEAIDYWKKYIADLENSAILSPRETPVAQALVWKRIAEIYVSEIGHRSKPGARFLFDDVFDDLDFDAEEGDLDFLDDDELEKKTRDSIECSLDLAPQHRPTYDLLVELDRMLDQPEKLARARQRLIQAFPDDVDTLIEMATDLCRSNQHASALELVTRARTHKPLDEYLLTVEIGIRKALARSLALEKRWEGGRAQFAAIERLRPAELGSFTYLAIKTVFETKAGQRDLADRYESEAAALLAEPAPLWLAMRVETILFQLTKATQKHYHQLWKTELRKKCRSETAGAMARFLNENTAAESSYAGSDGDASEYIKYVRRSSRLNYQLEDLEPVCQYLVPFHEELKLLSGLVGRGLKFYPQSAILHMIAAGIEMRNPGFLFRMQPGLDHLREALRLAEASSRREVKRLVSGIKHTLSMMNETSSHLAELAHEMSEAGPSRGGTLNNMGDYLNRILGKAAIGQDEEPDDSNQDDNDDLEDGDPPSFFGTGFSGHRHSGGKSKGKPRSGSRPRG